MKKQCENPTEVVKEMFWLAWQACGGTSGMGVFRNQPGASREQVWENVTSAGDYSGGTAVPGFRQDNEAYGDYVFGRMMKLGVPYGADYVELYEDVPRPDYQGWCLKYPSYEALYEAALKNLTESPQSV